MNCDRANYRFFVITMMRNGFAAAKIHEFLTTAWPEESPSLVTVHRIMREVKEGTRTSLEDAARSGPPITAAIDANVQQVTDLLKVDNRMSTRAISGIIGVAPSTVHAILHNRLHLKSLCSKWVPKELGDNQKQARMDSAKELIDLFQSTDDPHKIIYVDEKWFYHRSLGSKATNRSWCATAADKRKVARRSQGDAKSHVVMAASFGGDSYFELVPACQNITGSSTRNSYNACIISSSICLTASVGRILS